MTFEEKFRKFIGTEKKYCIDCSVKVNDEDKENKPVEFKDRFRCSDCAKDYKENKRKGGIL